VPKDLQTDLATQLLAMRRPGLLLQAARIAAAAPCAERRARRRPVSKLLAEEAALNAARLGYGPGYSPRRHVQVISALMSAASSERAAALSERCDQMKASGISDLRRAMKSRNASSMPGSSAGAS